MKTVQILMRSALAFMALAWGILAGAQGGQTVRGLVFDDVSKTPLAGVSVVISLQNQLLAASTAADGSFKIGGVPTGRQTLSLSVVNYEHLVLPNIVVTAGKEVVLTIGLTEKISVLGNVVVTSSRNRLNNDLAVVSARSFSLEDTKRYAGALGDPSRMAANFAGVSGANDSRNDIVVRGNSPTGLLWQMEGLNIPNPNHFGSLSSTGGPVSILNNNVLDKSDFLTSAFPATYGNAVAGVFDLKLRNGNAEKHEFLGQIGFNGIEAGAEGPLSKTSKASYLVNYRYSTLALFKALGFSATGAATPFYQDWTTKVNLPLSGKTTLALFTIGGSSKVDFLGNDADTSAENSNLYGNENENTRVKYFTTISGATLTHQHNSRVFSKLSVGLFTTNERFNGDSISVTTRQEFASGEARFKTNKLAIGYANTVKFNSQTSISSGLQADFIGFHLYNRAIYGGGTSERVRINTSDNTLLTQAYTTLKHRFNGNLTLSAGLHLQHLALNSSWAVEPRVGLRYKLNPRQYLSLGYGLHSQMQNIYTYYVQTPQSRSPQLTNQYLNFTRSQHLVLGYDLALGSHTRLKAETYYQYLYDVPVERPSSSYSALNTGASFAPDNTDSLINNGSGTNYGVELTLERTFHRGFYALATVSIFDSRYKGSDGVERNTAFNSRYVANLLMGKEWIVGKKKAVLGADLHLSTQGGRYLTPIDAVQSAQKGEAVYREDAAFSEQQSAYFRLDFKVLYRRNFRHTALEVSVDFQNLTNRQNVFLQQYNRRTNSVVPQYQQGFFPVPTVRFTF
jgi:hypothetical protein